MKILSTIVLLFWPVGLVVAADSQPAFTQALTAVRDGGGVEIEFAVDRATDVAVTVEDARGKIVRHLVAGVLGKNPPEPLRAKSLAQSLVWDGKDDAGKAAMGGPFQVCVRLGMQALFERFLLYQPNECGPISSVAVGPQGAVYVFHRDSTVNGNQGGDRFWYSYMYGSIIKFPPTGGIIWHQPTLPKSAFGEPPTELLAQPRQPFKRHFGYSPHLTGEIQGALWTRFGYSPYSAHMTGNTSHCMCEGSGFDVDPFGRVFFPNVGQFRIEVIDTNNNPLTTFGQYGNEDSGGPQARINRPAIPLAWPTYVAVSDRYAYIADTVNRRVVRVKLSYAAEAMCDAPPAP